MRLEFTELYQPWFVFYESGFPLQFPADYIFQVISDLQSQLNFQSLFLVAHSMGGLVTKAFINRYRQTEDQYLKLFVTLATPWGGHLAANWGVRYAPEAIPSWRDIAPESDFLASLNLGDLPANLPFYLLFGYRGGSLLTPGADDGVVSVASQLETRSQALAKKVYGFKVSHREILKDKAVSQQLQKILQRRHKELMSDLR